MKSSRGVVGLGALESMALLESLISFRVGGHPKPQKLAVGPRVSLIAVWRMGVSSNL